MLSKTEIEQKLMAIKPMLVKKFFVRKIGYFGSFSKGCQTEESDLDVLVEFDQPVGWEFFALEQFLEEQLGIRIDLVTKNSLKERIKDSILKQVRYI
ncbi:MAG: nucleotidyltransferase family protein [Bacteroidota bacterium]